MITELDVNVYCMEELCYTIKENAFLLDKKLMGDPLIDWIGDCLGLVDLAKALYPIVHKQGSFSQFIETILVYVGLYDSEVIREVCQVVKKSSGLSGVEKRKEQIDFLMEKGKYMIALRNYRLLLAQWEEAQNQGKPVPDQGVKAAILHNMGVAYAGMLSYDRAAEEFHEAYQISGDDGDYLSYLAAKRFMMREEEYLNFVSGEMEHYNLTLELEKQMEAARAAFEQHPKKIQLEKRAEMKNGGERQLYYEDNDLLTRALKLSYRSCMGE